RPAVYPHRVPHAAAVPLRPAPALLRFSARVLDDAHDDARAPRVRGGDDRVHRAGDPVRGAGPRGRARRRLRTLPRRGADAVAVAQPRHTVATALESGGCLRLRLKLNRLELRTPNSELTTSNVGQRNRMGTRRQPP